MRAAILLAALAACSPDIAPESYLCGVDSSCPTGQVCNGPDNSCVNPATAEAFVCDPSTLHEPDQTIAQAFQLPPLDCVSLLTTAQGCLAAGDSQNWVAFDVPANCSAVQVQASVQFPIAFEPLSLELAASDGTSLGDDTDCSNVEPSDVTGLGQRCLAITVTPGGHFGIRTAPAGGDDCDGGCNFNRYQLTVQLATP